MNRKVLILMGSDSDRDTLAHMQPYLDFFGIDADWKVSSAHRNPETTADLAKNAAKEGYAAIIAAAGMAAHLAGVCAAHTMLPVIAIPLAATLNGLDALLSSVQMPAGVPVAVVSIGKAGAINAACLAARFIAVDDAYMRLKLDEFKKMGSRLKK